MISRKIAISTSLQVDSHESSLGEIKVPRAAPSQPRKMHREEILESTPREAEKNSVIMYASEESSLQENVHKVMPEPLHPAVRAQVSMPTDPTPREENRALTIEQKATGSDFQIPALQQSHVEDSSGSARAVSIPSSATYEHPGVPQHLKLGKDEKLQVVDILAV